MTTTRKKLLFLITKSTWYGAQRYVYDVATALPNNQYEIVVALGGDGPLATKLMAAGVRVISIPGLQRDISLKQELLASWHIAHIIKDEDPDILHVNSSKAGVIGSFLGRILGVPRVVFTAHGWAFNEDRGRLSKFILKAIHWSTILFAHHTIAVSQAIKQQMNWGGVQHKMTVVHNGRATPTFLEKTAAREKLANQSPTLLSYLNDFWTLTIGELHYTKGQDVVIKAMAEIVPTNPHTRHLIIGSGEYRPELEHLIQSLHLQNNVFLLGALDEAAQYLKAADVFVLASRTEALSYVVTEAAMAELPIVASDVGGIPEIVTTKESALLTTPEDISQITAAIHTYRTDTATAQEYAAAARTRSQNFSIAAMRDQTIAVYEARD